jgi:hypothetical protein
LETLDLFFDLGSDIDYSMINALILMGLRLFLPPKQENGVIALIRWLVQYGYNIIYPYGPIRPEEIARASLYYALTQVSSTTSQLIAQGLLPSEVTVSLTPAEPKTKVEELLHHVLFPYHLVFGLVKKITLEGELTKQDQTLINDALIIAVAQGYTEIVSTFLRVFKDSIQEQTRQKAFINAVFGDRAAIALHLLENSSIASDAEDIRRGWARTLGRALVIAAANGRANSVDLILGKGVAGIMLPEHLGQIVSDYLREIKPRYIESALIRATRWGHFAIARQLLDLIIQHKVRIEEKTWPTTITQTITFAALQGDIDDLDFFMYVFRQTVKLDWSTDIKKVLENIKIFLENKYLSDKKRKSLENARDTIQKLLSSIEAIAKVSVIPEAGRPLQSLLATLPPHAMNLILALLIGRHLEKPSST